MLKQLKREVNHQVQEALENGQDIDIASVHISVTEDGDDIIVAGFGRGAKPSKSYHLLRQVEAEVMNQIKRQYRDTGPEAALNDIRN